MSKNAKKAKKSLAEQILEAFGLLQSKSNASPRRYDANANAPGQPPNRRPENPAAPTTPARPAPPSPPPVATPPRTASSGAPNQNPGALTTTGAAGRIKWGPEPSSPKPEAKPAPKPPGGGVVWGGSGGSKRLDLESLVGAEDAFDHTLLTPGERVAVCTLDKVGYHLSTWEFLRDQNRGCCCICGKPTGIQIHVLPGTFVDRPKQPAPGRPPVILRPGERIISLKEVPDYLDMAVTVQDYVYKVHRSQKGTFFVRFEPLKPGQPVYDGFKVVIFNNYAQRWEDEGLSIENYQHRYIRVRGVVQEHPTWGMEILVNSPRLIEVVNAAK